MLLLSSAKAFSVLTTRHCHRRRAPRSLRSFTSTSLHDRNSNPGEREVEKSSGNDPGNTSQFGGWRTVPLGKVVSPQTRYSKDDFSVLRKVDLRPITSPYKPSPVEVVTVRGREVYIKRDDLLRLEGSNVSGNKARKMFALNQIPAKDFPKCIVSYGGCQSNAMLALAAVVQSKNRELMCQGNEDDQFCDDRQEEEYPPQAPQEKRFVYYCKKLPRFLRKNPSGNYFRAKALGMEMVEVTNDEYRDLFGGDSGGKPDAPVGLKPPVDGDSVWIPQGGASGFVVPGCRLLASEILLFWAANSKGRPLSVLVPGGTCSTAVILHREIRRMQASSESGDQLDIQVVVIPCVGDEGYAERQMMALNMETGGVGDKDEIPFVLKPAPDATFYLEDKNEQRYFRFGEPDSEILHTFREMEDYGVKVDLLYGAPAWNVLLRHWSVDGEAESKLLSGREILYVHSGGLEGINTQLMRYRHKGLVDGRDVQHPERQRRSSKNFLDST